MVLKGKAALVTGAAGKLGWAICAELAAAGYHIGVHYHRAGPRADEVIAQLKQLGRTALPLKANLAVAKECDALVERAYDGLGRLDVFVHCASSFVRMPLGEITAKDWDELSALNMRAALLLSQSIGMRMKQEVRDGHIIHFSDITRDRPYGDYLPYCMSKAAIETMVKGLAVRLAPEVKVNAIAPYMARAQNQLSDEDKKKLDRIPMKRSTEPQEIARLVRVIVGEGTTMTGELITIDGGRRLVW